MNLGTLDFALFFIIIIISLWDFVIILYYTGSHIIRLSCVYYIRSRFENNIFYTDEEGGGKCAYLYDYGGGIRTPMVRRCAARGRYYYCRRRRSLPACVAAKD